MWRVFIFLLLIGCTGDGSEEDSEFVIDTDTVTDTHVDTDSDRDVDSDSDLDSETETETDSETETETEADTETDIETDGETDTETETETETESSTDVDTESDSGGDADTDADTETEEEVGYPRFILRDKFGEAVEAIVSADTYHDGQEHFTSGDIGCVHLEFLGDSYIGLSYGTSSGRLGACKIRPYAQCSSWASCAGVGHTSASCTGTPYAVGYASTNLFSVIEVTGNFHFVEGLPDVVSPDQLYVTNYALQCFSQPNPEGAFLWKYELVPQWVVNALPDAPYTVSLEY